MVFTRAGTSTSGEKGKGEQNMAEEEDVIPQQRRNHVETRRTLLDGINSKGTSSKTTINIELAREVTFKPDNTLISSLPSFYGRPSEDPYDFLDDYHMMLSSQIIIGLSTENLKMLYLPFVIKEKAKDWYKKLGSTFNSWEEVEEKFLLKFYPLSKKKALIKDIQTFSQLDGETFSESWERFKDLIRKCPHHDIKESDLAQDFYDALSDSHKQKVDNMSGGYFYHAFEDEVFDILERVADIDL